jgi:hypothetical protein
MDSSSDCWASKQVASERLHYCRSSSDSRIFWSRRLQIEFMNWAERYRWIDSHYGLHCYPENSYPGSLPIHLGINIYRQRRSMIHWTSSLLSCTERHRLPRPTSQHHDQFFLLISPSPKRAHFMHSFLVMVRHSCSLQLFYCQVV